MCHEKPTKIARGFDDTDLLHAGEEDFSEALGMEEKN